MKNDVLKKQKLMTIVGTRPELIRLSETIKKADKYFTHVFVHTGQNYDYGLNGVFYEDLSIREPDYYLNVAGENLGRTMGAIIEKSYACLRDVRPDALLILGDTNSALSAISAKRLKIPVFHMEAGNRCFDENLPEEINRRLVDHISDVHLPYTEHARRYLLSEGIPGRYIFVTGSPMTEVIEVNKRKIEASTILEELGIKEHRYIVVSSHREENIDNEVSFAWIMSSINALAERYEIPIIYSVHPRSAKFIKEREFKFNPLVKEMPPFSFTDFSLLMKKSFCVVSDSGTLPEESAIGMFPAVSIRTSTERPEAIDCGSFILGGIEQDGVLRAVETAVSMRLSEDVPNYKSLNVSDKVIRIIQGYTDVVNRDIWRKHV